MVTVDASVKDDETAIVVRLLADNQFDRLLLQLFDCATPTFRYEGSALIAVLRKSDG